MKKFRVGFIVDDLSPSIQTNELIEFINSEDIFDAPVLITGYKNEIRGSIFSKITAKAKAHPTRVFDALLRGVFARIICWVELKKTKKRFQKYKANCQIKNLSEFKIVNVEGAWSKSKLFLEMTNEDLCLISNYDLDCLIRCGSGILRGGILEVTRFGVISFHHGDNRTNRGGPSGFWEVLNGEPSTGFVIQKLNSELDGGEVLFRGSMMTSGSWLENNAQLLAKSNIFMTRLLRDLAKTNSLPRSEGVRLHGNKLYKLDSSFFLIKYFAQVILPKAWDYLLSKCTSPKTKIWSVAYGDHNNFSKSLWRYNEITNPKGRYLGDPFVIDHCGETFIFVEDFFLCDGKGRISAIKVDGDNYEFLGVALEEDFHLSFPFVFKDGGDIYMVPESCESSNIRLYKSIDFPLKWEFEMELMADVDAADTMLIKNDDTWFMLTNICSAKIGDHQSELHIFYADDFRETDWTPIQSGNPVIFDALKGRNGGFFRHEGKLYRINQVHGQSHYGKSFCVNEVITLSTKEYVEKEVANVEPNFMDSAISTHHFNANQKTAAVDFQRLKRL